MLNPLAQSDALRAFYQALDEVPDDTVTVRALADWHDEQGDADAAACLRWAAEAGRRPSRYHPRKMRMSRKAWRAGWLWWAVDDPWLGAHWGHPPTCRLPRALWENLAHTFDYKPSVFKDYPDSRAAYEALIDAWPGYQPRRAAEGGTESP